jgi:hypothetical protein
MEACWDDSQHFSGTIKTTANMHPSCLEYVCPAQSQFPFDLDIDIPSLLRGLETSLNNPDVQGRLLWRDLEY